jgi:glycosyltransferase involved in cell wall biosynthesis
MLKNPKTAIVLPAYNAEKTLYKTLADIPYEYVGFLVLADDCSKDDTVKVAKDIREQEIFINKENFYIIELPKNLGYGGNQKTCYDKALSLGADIVIMLHPDYQYDPRAIADFIKSFNVAGADVVLGSRIRNRTESISGGMPIYKYYSNRFLSILQNLITGENLSEWHTGMRAYNREVLESIKYKDFSNDFIFDTEMLLSIVARKYKIGEVAVPVRYFKEASSINFKRSLRYGILTFFHTLKYLFGKYKD